MTSSMIHLSGLDALFTSASISYPGSPETPIIKVVTKFKDPTIALNDVLNQYPDYSDDSLFQFCFGRAEAGFSKSQIIKKGINASFTNFQYYIIPQLIETRITIPSAYGYFDCSVPGFTLDTSTGICTMSLEYVFMAAGEPTQDDITAAVKMFCYAPILDSISITDEGAANPSIYFSNGGDHLVFNELANTDLPSDIVFLSFSDFDGASRNYELSDLKFSGN